MALTKATFSMIDGEIASIRDFGAVGDGVTDDTAALTAFFNHANANPGVRHLMDPLTYAVTAPLPDINVSSVWIEGAGAEIHDTGALVTGTVLKWTGAAATTGPLVKITAVSGAGNQRISSVTFAGIGIDCNSGALLYGLEILSARFCNIDVAIANAGTAGMQLDVVATLGEGKDLQRNNISLKSRQLEAPNGFGMILGGDAVANVSMNRFWVDAQIANIQSIYCVNSDNNIWDYVRIFKTPAGTATEGVSLLGGAANAEKARAEIFNFYTANTPIHVYGTSGSPSFVFPSVGNVVFLDKENGTPDPTIEAGGEIGIIYNTTALPENAWVNFTPVVTASTGTITAYTAEARYIKRGKLLTISVNVEITNNGTGAGELRVSLPAATIGMPLGGTILAGRERNLTSAALTAYVEAATSTAKVLTYNGLYPGAAGAAISFAGSYQIA
jgi:hypothetical protein